MCGVVGIISWDKDPTWRQETLARLLIESQHRGREATGIMFIRNNQLCVMKDGVTADEFVRTENYQRFTTELPNLVIGHTRSASRSTSNGADKNENNHPFYNPEIGLGLIHNGFVDDDPWRRLADKKDGTLLNPFLSGTDSEAALRILETFVVRDAGPMIRNIENLCLNIAGNYTFGILRQDSPNKMWWVNHVSPLCAAYIPSRKSVVFASTTDILEKATKEKRYILNFFVQHDQPPGAVYNSIPDNYLLEVTLLEKAPWVHFKAKTGLKTATQSYEDHKRLGKTEEVVL